ncbi:uncharacterized exonuclease domain-containing protein At3g15140 [Ricinus communis]|uniref:Exonuclease, putative n=1 Tax=Ricinus communis TaxID=3988 RepID=B9SBA1_RICCO|nr:uncharacterized exonuclease domain-containing protein At3g15140 [Ricinus communis]EEF39109.1 exonuclease, putative [Ricinus communis]|eukprot:XP_002523270.1 uncharacterized exonuclease domain-containing protein At3g15140 [Ricinus communis]
MSLVRVITPCKIPSSCSNFVIPVFRNPRNNPLAFRTLPKFNITAKYAQITSSASSTTPSATYDDTNTYRWKPMCLYFTHGKCTKMDDPTHLEVFNHDCSRDLPVNAADFKRKRPQDFEFFLVFDLEGKVEILEFPVLIIDAKTMAFVDLFHRFVRPSAMSEQRINEYIENKYGKFGVDRVWHDTALPFNEVIQEFEAWLTHHHLWEKKHGGHLNRAAFVTCGNWDVKTQIPRQCTVSKIKLPRYFMEWINLKDVYQNFYNPKQEARGMRTMMQQLKIPMLGSHHLGIDDTKNVARILQRMLADGAVIPITAWRNPDSIGNVNFLYKNRI